MTGFKLRGRPGRFIKLIPASCLLCLLVTACTSTPVSPKRPEWIDNPGDRVVGRCGTHIRGAIAQQACAYRNGLSYLAMSKGVKVDVDATTTMQQTSGGNDARSYGSMNAKMELEGRGIHIKAHIVEKWHDKLRDILYLLIEEDKP